MTDWSKIKQAYEESDMTVKALCEIYQISHSALYRRIDQEGWLVRKGRENLKGDGERLIDRLYKAFEQQMNDFEAAFQAEEAISEKDARTLGTLARTLEKLIDLKNDQKETETLQDNEVDIDDLREELARRLKLMREKGMLE